MAENGGHMASGGLSHAFGPGDITAVAILPDATFVIDEVIDASYSEHADTPPVRRLGHRLPVGHARGAATIAGTLVCGTFGNSPLWKLRHYYGAIRVFGEQAFRTADEDFDVVGRHLASAVSVTQLPPFHLMFIHSNDEGQMGIRRLYNVIFSDQGTTFGANNAFEEETFQFQCTYAEDLRLHRSLNIYELQALARRAQAWNEDDFPDGPATQSGFFSNPYGNERLVESLAAVSAQFGAETQSDALKYLMEETKALEERVAEGRPTSFGVADTGGVTFTGPEQSAADGSGEGGGGVATSTGVSDFNDGVVSITETFLRRPSGDAESFTASIVIDRNAVHLVEGAYLGGTLTETTKLGMLKEGQRTALPAMTGAAYLERISGEDGSDFVVPPEVQFVISENNNDVTIERRAGTEYASGTLDQTGSEMDISGIYQTPAPPIEQLTLLSNGDQYDFVYTINNDLVVDTTATITDDGGLDTSLESDHPLSRVRVADGADDVLIREGVSVTSGFLNKRETLSPVSEEDAWRYEGFQYLGHTVTASVNKSNTQVTFTIEPVQGNAGATEALRSSTALDSGGYIADYEDQNVSGLALVAQFTEGGELELLAYYNDRTTRRLVGQSIQKTNTFEGDVLGLASDLNIGAGTIGGTIGDITVPPDTESTAPVSLIPSTLDVRFETQNGEARSFARWRTLRATGTLNTQQDLN